MAMPMNNYLIGCITINMKNMSIRQTSRKGISKGFTIVEIMIATLVFSVVLVLITTGIIEFTRVYYGGVNQAQTQNVAKRIIENISQAIQFSGESVTDMKPGVGGWQGVCIGSNAYQYRLGQQLVDSGAGGDKVTQAFILTTGLTGCADATAGSASSLNGGRELLSPNMRVSNLEVKSLSGSLYSVTIEVAFGDDDLLHSMTGSDGAQATDVACNSSAGSQFCAVSKLSTTVEQRLNPDQN